ncbi:MAG: hypothetical protein EOO87_07990 [Pedobacter sp.]|nr:MAG: hypothetical protein EOO87_07990 [Pedobacter sp.]
MRKYARISGKFISRGEMGGLDRDDIVTESINKKLQEFVKLNKVVNYQVIHAETTVVPDGAFTSGYNLVSLHLEYEV